MATIKLDRAVVIGASVAGLLAGRALSSHFGRVIVLDQDELPERGARAGVPQGWHTHALLPDGARVIEKLFPGRLEELVRNGAQRFDYGRSRFHMIGGWMPRIETELVSFAQTRSFLEGHLRRWLGEVPNVAIKASTRVVALVFDGHRVAGVELEGGGRLDADLVIDATGRNTRLPRWLAEWGFGKVPESRVGFNLGYATGRFRVPDRVRPDHPILYIVGRPPRRTRVGVILQVEDGMVFSAMGGYHGDHPPVGFAGFLEFAKSLGQPEIYDVLREAELMEPIRRYRIPESVRRYYGRMRRFPEGILPIGDSVCSLDPAFGQGMTVAAQEADALAADLDARSYFARMDAIVDVPWELSCGENFKYPQTTGRRPLLFSVTRTLKDRVARSGDPAVVAEFYKVLALSARPKTLLRARVVARVIRSLISKSQK